MFNQSGSVDDSRTDRTITRRSAIAAGGVFATAALAGCLNGDDDDDDDENGLPGGLDPDDWEGIDSFTFEGTIQEWTGVEPSIIEGESNPPIVLFEGEEYDFHWINADGVRHNMEIRDGDGNIIDDYESEEVQELNAEASIEGVVATEEMDVYICRFHATTQVGDIHVVSD